MVRAVPSHVRVPRGGKESGSSKAILGVDSQKETCKNHYRVQERRKGKKKRPILRQKPLYFKQHQPRSNNHQNRGITKVQVNWPKGNGVFRSGAESERRLGKDWNQPEGRAYSTAQNQGVTPILTRAGGPTQPRGKHAKNNN